MLYVEKAKILWKQGNAEAAAAAAEKGRILDLQDRYMNNQAAIFFLRNNQADAADETLVHFLKQTDFMPYDVHLTMWETQSYWYSLDRGDCFLRQGDVISALENYLQLETQQDDNHAELTDFHWYTLKRSNIRAWIDVIQTEDNFSGTDFYLLYAPVEAYMKLHDDGLEACQARRIPPPTTEHAEELAALPDVEVRRVEKVKKELYPNIDTSEPLEKCGKYITALQTYLPHWAKTHELAFEVALRANRPLLCAAAIHKLENRKDKAAAIVGGLEAAAPLKAKLREWVGAQSDPIPAVVQTFLDKVL